MQCSLQLFAKLQGFLLKSLCVQERVQRLIQTSAVLTAMQAFVTLGVLIRWLVLAGQIPSIGIIAGSIAYAVPQLLELAMVIVLLLSLLGALVHVQLGERIEAWNTFGKVMRGMLREFFAEFFARLRKDFFGSPIEMTMLDEVTAYIVSWGAIFLCAFLLFNCAIALVFTAYYILKDVYAKKAALDKKRLANARV